VSACSFLCVRMQVELPFSVKGDDPDSSRYRVLLKDDLTHGCYTLQANSIASVSIFLFARTRS